MTPARSPYGDLADDVALLATAGKVITRHDGMYRLDGAAEKLTAAMVRGMAAMVRNQRWEAAHAPRFKDGHEIKKTAVLDTRPGGGGASGTNEGHDAAPATPICVKCEGPISKWSKGQCAVCYAQAGRGPYPQRPTAERPDKFWRAVEPANESDQIASPSHQPVVTSKMVERPAAGSQEPTTLQGPMPNAGDGGETAATRCRPSPLNSDAAPSGRVDVVVSDVPPAATPQTASGPGRSAVTPAPESGASAGTISDALTANPLGAYCGCGALRSHTGRCWHRRGLTGPEPAKQTPHKRSRTRKHRKAAGIPARILALENANEANERKIAALEALMSMEGLR